MFWWVRLNKRPQVAGPAARRAAPLPKFSHRIQLFAVDGAEAFVSTPRRFARSRIHEPNMPHQNDANRHTVLNSQHTHAA